VKAAIRKLARFLSAAFTAIATALRAKA